MEFTKEQLSELICKHTEKGNGVHDLMQIMLESLMVSERREYLRKVYQARSVTATVPSGHMGTDGH